jgi:hypothetical protein
MEQFVRRQNIKRYRALLRETKDEATRRLIQKLLTEEEEAVCASDPPENGRSTPRKVVAPKSKAILL